MALPKVPGRTTPGFAFSILNRALRECLGRRQFGNAEIQHVLAFFGNNPPRCAFCGDDDVKRWDHLVPIKNGGETVLGNMVPACATCDDSKRDLPWDQWIISDSENSPRRRGTRDTRRRSQRIGVYIREFGYSVDDINDRLSKPESRRYDAILATLEELRGEVDSLISDYRSRNG